jgi:bleomycin hydrolase
MKRLFGLIFVMIISTFMLSAQEDTTQKKEGFQFTSIKENPTTSVKDQYKSGTCWAFSTLSFLESELLRTGKGEYDLSEAFIVRNTYIEKAIRYVRFQGKTNFSPGGGFRDITYVINKYGIVPEEVYTGLNYGTDKHVHAELDAVLKAYVDQIIKNPNRELTTAWLDGYIGILDAYFGKVPEKFIYKGQEYTPITFAQSLGLNMDDYVEISSFTHHPFYEQFILEIPDNWLHGMVYNVPLDEMMRIIDYSIENGYTVAWGSDVSEKGFKWSKGIAVVPDETLPDLTGTEKERWEKLTDAEKQKQIYAIDGPVKEKIITQELRQIAFDNYNTTDDHGMHITGIAKDQKGNIYYKVKNSWGLSGPYEGYFYASKPFVAYKTTGIMINKNSIPKDIRKKLGL